MKKTKQNNMMLVVVMFVIVIAVAIGFWSIMQHSRANKNKEQASANEEVCSILEKDFENNYPGTPREVVKLYSRITACIYNQAGEKDRRQLVEKMRQLFDEELLEGNPLEEQLEDLEGELKEFHANKSIITSYTVDKNSSVVKEKIDGRQCATLRVSYLMQQGKAGSYTKSVERFLLREDENKNWKIYGWKLVDEEVTEEE